MFVQTIYMHNARFSLLTLVHVPLASLGTAWHSMYMESIYIDIYECRRWATRMREHARDARRILNYSIHGDISISLTLLRTRFSLPPPLPVERPSLLNFLITGMLFPFLIFLVMVE